MTSIMLRSALIRSWLSNILHSSSFILCHCCEFSSHTSRYFLTSVIMVWTFQQRSLVLAHLHAIWRNTYISSLRRSVVQKAKRMRRGESSYTRNGITRRSKRLRDYRVRTLVFRTLQIVSGQFVYFEKFPPSWMFKDVSVVISHVHIWLFQHKNDFEMIYE